MGDHRLVFEGSDDVETLQEKLQKAIDDERNDRIISEIEFIDIIWASKTLDKSSVSEFVSDTSLNDDDVVLSFEDVNNILMKRSFSKVTVEGGQGQYPWQFQSVKCLCFRRV